MIIRLIQGRKMSKTLGNVIDPIDTIKEFGADGLRFTLALGTAGQDLNLSIERLTANKVFTNKLWNAGKFIFQNMPNQSDHSAWERTFSFKFDSVDSLERLPLPECWVAVLLYVFENVLKLLHPFMPFVTEELWQALPHRKHALTVSQWPRTSLPWDEKSVKKFDNLQALVKSVRNARAEYSVEPSKQISASTVASVDVLDYISFVEKAPEAVVRGVREKAIEAEEKISLTKNRLALMESSPSSL